MPLLLSFLGGDLGGKCYSCLYSYHDPHQVCHDNWYDGKYYSDCFFLSWYWYVRCADPDDGGCRDGEYHDDIIIVIVIILKIVIAILIVNITPESYSWWSCPAITIIILSVMAEMLIVDLGCKILETEINLTSTVLWLKKAGLLGLDVFPRLRCHCYYYLSLIIIIILIIFQ